MGGPKKGPKIPEILFEIRTKKNLEQNLPFGESELELNRFPLSSIFTVVQYAVYPRCILLYIL